MLIHSMQTEEMIEEVNRDLFEITLNVVSGNFESGRVTVERKRLLKKMPLLKRRKFYKKYECAFITSQKNKWNIVIHMFHKCDIWQGYTTVAGSNHIQTIFYEWGSTYFIDAHFFSRYRERYLTISGIQTNSSVDYFNKTNDVFTDIPMFLDELMLNRVMVMLKHGIGLGEAIDYIPKKTIFGNGFDISDFKNFRINTFLGFQNLKKTQLDEIIEFIRIEIDTLKSISMRNDLSRFGLAMKRLKYEQLNMVVPELMKRYNEY